MKFVAQPPIDVPRKFHSLATGHQHDMRAEPRQRIDEGMDRAAALQVAGDDNIQFLEVAFLALKGEQIAQGLCGMFMRAVAAIDDGHSRSEEHTSELQS